MMPERVLKMYELRREGKTLREIAAIFDVTPAGVAHNLYRWADWAKEQS
jgi:DNA-binding CsgD family transcriptional regulator